MNLGNIKNDAGLKTLAIRMVIGWTYFSAFWRRTILADKLDPEMAGYIGEKFNHFLPNALFIKPIIQYLVENPDMLWLNMVIFTIIEGIVGLFIIFGLFTRAMSVGVIGLAMGILLGSGWIGTTCLDEWQIGVLGISTGFILFLTGSGKYSLDNYLMKNKYAVTDKSWFPWIASGTLPMKDTVYPKFVLIGSLFIMFITLGTNQVFHGGLWGTLHNKSVKPKLEITETHMDEKNVSFDLFRTEGVDVYGSWVIKIEIVDSDGTPVVTYDQDKLTALNPELISNYYVAKIKSGKHSLIVPLGAKANIHLPHGGIPVIKDNYKIKITDISGLNWEQAIHTVHKS